MPLNRMNVLKGTILFNRTWQAMKSKEITSAALIWLRLTALRLTIVLSFLHIANVAKDIEVVMQSYGVSWFGEIYASDADMIAIELAKNVQQLHKVSVFVAKCKIAKLHVLPLLRHNF